MEYEAGENNYFSDVMEKFVEQSDNFESYLDSLHDMYKQRNEERKRQTGENFTQGSDQTFTQGSKNTLKDYKDYVAKDLGDLLDEIKNIQKKDKDKKFVKTLQFEKNNHTK